MRKAASGTQKVPHGLSRVCRYVSHGSIRACRGGGVVQSRRVPGGHGYVYQVLHRASRGHEEAASIKKNAWGLQDCVRSA